MEGKFSFILQQHGLEHGASQGEPQQPAVLAPETDRRDVIIIDGTKLPGNRNYEWIRQMKSYTHAILKSTALFNFTQLQQRRATLDKSGHFPHCKCLCLELWLKWLIFVAMFLCL